MRAVDLFCGAGGLTLGLRRAGWDVAGGVDLDAAAGLTYRRNNPGARFLAADLRCVSGRDVRALAGGARGRELLLAGCPPCRPFSKQRRAAAPAPVGEAALLGEFGRLVAELRPRAVLLENVPGLAAGAGAGVFREFLRVLRAGGWRGRHAVVNARDWGVPQHRRRCVLLASRGGRAALPAPAPGPPATVRSAIERFPPLAAGRGDASVPNHRAAGLSARNLRRLRATPPDGGGRRDWPPGLGLECHRGARGFSDVYGRMWWDRPAPTLTSRCNSLSNGRFGHPEQHRAVSLREAAALQSFPDDYEFFGSQSRVARWIGNAVPVALAEALGAAARRAAGAPGSG